LRAKNFGRAGFQRRAVAGFDDGIVYRRGIAAECNVGNGIGVRRAVFVGELRVNTGVCR
jgi:hypothetical protein